MVFTSTLLCFVQTSLGLSPKYIAAEPLEFSDMTSNEVIEMNCDDILSLL